MITGALAVTVHDTIMTPMDGTFYIVIKQRIQLNRQQGPISMAQKLVRTEGIMSLYRSFPITLIMNVPQSMIFMTIYENLKAFFYPSNNVSISGYFLCASISSGIAAGITTPLDVIKTRLQTQTEESHLKARVTGTLHRDAKSSRSYSDYKPRYTSIKQTIIIIYGKEGYRGFLRGAVPRMLYFLPGAAISWGAYEYIKKLII